MGANKSLRGTRWEDQDPRQGNRVVRIVGDDLPKHPPADRILNYEIEVAEFAPQSVGKRYVLTEETLRKHYKKISR